MERLALHQQLYNAALEQRIAAWRSRRLRVTFAEQCRNLTQLRADDARYAALGAQSAQVTLKRLDLAFRSFFRRCKGKQVPGFPRFKALERFSGWGYKTHGDGFRFVPASRNRHGRLILSGVGTIPVRGRARTPGDVATCEITRKDCRWYAVLTLRVTPSRAGGRAAIGLDWGVSQFATLAHEDGSFREIGNPRFVRSTLTKVTAAQIMLSRTSRGSKNRAKARRIVSAIHRKIANRRRDFLHKESAKLVGSASLIATETLAVANMTGSAKGSIGSPGRHVAQKAGLNREILSTSPSAFLAMLQYKAAEAGTGYIEVPSRAVKPSQRCSGCWLIRKKSLAERQHVCGCGLVLGRDRNAARVNLLWALANTGREPAGRQSEVSAS